VFEAVLLCAGVETLLDDAIAADPEWPKLLAVPQLLDNWADHVQSKWQAETDEFKVGAVHHVFLSPAV
jgi:hypothetical protein